MSNEIYLKTMILTVKYSELDYKDDLLEILKNSKLKFGNIENQEYENIDLIVPNKIFKKAKKLKNKLRKIAKTVYIEVYKFKFGNLVIKSIDSNNNIQNEN
ncbi:MAG: hypothetical protein ACQEQE_05475 [Bacillota bacterium]